jgi:hypothetical protein
MMPPTGRQLWSLLPGARTRTWDTAVVRITTTLAMAKNGVVVGVSLVAE